MQGDAMWFGLLALVVLVCAVVVAGCLWVRFWWEGRVTGERGVGVGDGGGGDGGGPVRPGSRGLVVEGDTHRAVVAGMGWMAAVDRAVLGALTDATLEDAFSVLKRVQGNRVGVAAMTEADVRLFLEAVVRYSAARLGMQVVDGAASASGEGDMGGHGAEGEAL